MPDAKKYFESSPERVSRDYKPTEKDLKIEKAARNIEETGMYKGREFSEEISDVVPKRAADWLNEMGLKTKGQAGNEEYEISESNFSERFGRMVRHKMFSKNGGEYLEFITIDSETGEILESKNIRFMDELPSEMVAKFEAILWKGESGEKSH